MERSLHVCYHPFRHVQLRYLSCLSLALAACSDPEYMSLPTTTPIEGACNGLLTVEASDPATHVDMGTSIAWSNNPPTSGSHYPIWAAWDRQYAQLPRGNYVHNAEHGGVILLYHCEPECPDVVSALLDVARAMAPDSKCATPVTKRVIVTSDPLLPEGVQVAAVAWEHAYTASCFDGYLATFAAEHYAKGPEDFCTEGANLGGTLINP